MNTTELVVELRPEKNSGPYEPMTSAILVQRSTNWANMPIGSWSLCWIAYIRFFTIMHIYDFHIFTVIIYHLEGLFGSNIMISI